MIVVDLGCGEHDGDSSIPYLVERFSPDVLYGFDPLVEDGEKQVGGTEVILAKKAAWVRDGYVDLGVGAHTLLDATIELDKNDHGEWRRTRSVPCFDFSEWLEPYLTDEVVVKMNVEGAEFKLLDRMVKRSQTRRLQRLFVMWHDHRMGNHYPAMKAELLEKAVCPVEEWTVAMAATK